MEKSEQLDKYLDSLLKLLKNGGKAGDRNSVSHWTVNCAPWDRDSPPSPATESARGGPLINVCGAAIALGHLPSRQAGLPSTHQPPGIWRLFSLSFIFSSLDWIYPLSTIAFLSSDVSSCPSHPAPLLAASPSPCASAHLARHWKQCPKVVWSGRCTRPTLCSWFSRHQP